MEGHARMLVKNYFILQIIVDSSRFSRYDVYDTILFWFNIGDAMEVLNKKNKNKSSKCRYSYVIIIIIISDSVYDRDQKPRYGIEVLLNLSRYQPALGNERINTKTNKYK